MLVLTRKLMEKVYIGDDICVTIVRLEGGQVRLGIDAPREIPVIRAELRIHDEEFEDLADEEAPARPRPAFRRCRPVPLGTGIRRRAPSR